MRNRYRNRRRSRRGFRSGDDRRLKRSTTSARAHEKKHCERNGRATKHKLAFSPNTNLSAKKTEGSLFRELRRCISSGHGREKSRTDGRAWAPVTKRRVPIRLWRVQCSRSTNVFPCPPGRVMLFPEWSAAIVDAVRKLVAEVRAARRGAQTVLLRSGKQLTALTDDGDYVITFGALPRPRFRVPEGAETTRTPRGDARRSVLFLQAASIPGRIVGVADEVAACTGSSMVEQLTLNQLVEGSSPSRCTSSRMAALRGGRFRSRR